MKIRLHVVVDKEDDAVVEVVQKALNEILQEKGYGYFAHNANSVRNILFKDVLFSKSITAKFSWLHGVLCDK